MLRAPASCLSISASTAALGLFTNEVGGDGRSIYDGVTMIPETERSNAMVSMTYDFTDNLRGFFDLSYANVLGIKSRRRRPDSAPIKSITASRPTTPIWPATPRSRER